MPDRFVPPASISTVLHPSRRETGGRTPFRRRLKWMRLGLAALGGLFVLEGVASAGPIGLGTTAPVAGGTTFTTSAAEVDTIVNTPVTQETDTYSLELQARMQGGGLLYDQFFSFPLGSTTVQNAIAAAEVVLTGAGAVSFLGPTQLSSVESLVSSVPIVVQNGKSLSNEIIGSDVDIGPQTILIGDFGVCQSYTLDANNHATPSGCNGTNISFTFPVAAGGADIDTFQLYLYDVNQTTTTTNTDLFTQVYEIDGVAAAANTNAVPEPGSAALLFIGLTGLSGFRFRNTFRSSHRRVSYTVVILKSALRATPILLLLSSGLRAQVASATLLTDDFTKDTALNSQLWSIGTPLMKALAQQTEPTVTQQTQPTVTTLLTPQLSFSSSGMTMQGTTGLWQYTGIQSNQSFAPPFTAQVTVKGTVSDANTFLFELTTGDTNHYIDLRGNLNPSNLPYYGMNLLSNIGGGAFLYTAPSLNVFYTITYTVTAAGMATIILTDPNGANLGTQSNIDIGTGPFYVVLGQFEGAPVTIGQNIAVWQQVQVTGPAPPAILSNGVVTASAFGDFPSVSPGSWIEIYGSNLAADARPWAASDFNGNNAPTSLDGTSITVGGKPAFIDYISPGQVNALLASDTPTGSQPLVLTYGPNATAAYTINVNSVEPGFLAPAAFLVGGIQYAVGILGDGSYAMPTGAIPGVASRPAKPGETMVLYGVGFGPVTPASAAGQVVQQANNLAGNFQISIGGKSATAQYSGLAPNFTGLYQFNIVVPAAASGTAALTFSVGGTAGTQTLYIAVGN